MSLDHDERVMKIITDIVTTLNEVSKAMSALNVRLSALEKSNHAHMEFHVREMQGKNDS